MASSHYFDRSPTTAHARHEVALALPDLTTTLVSDAGVFSADRVDPGTKLLLLEAPAPPTEGTILDLGCGYGPIAVTLAHRAPGATVWAHDVNVRALGLAAENLAPYPNARVGEPPPGEPLASIYSNPPVRIGKDGLRELLARWLPRLAPDGRAELVVHKHLGADSLARWLEDEGWSVERLVSRLGYRILEVTRR